MEIKIALDMLCLIGSRFRVSYLVEQAGYTFGMAAQAGTALADLLPKNFLTEAQAVLAQLAAGMQDRTLLAAESKDATRNQNAALQRAKVWRRRVATRALTAKRLGASLPDGLCRISQVKLVPDMVTQLQNMVKLLEANIGKLYGSDLPKLQAEGKSILNELSAADSTQEIKRLKALPDAVRKFYIEKGTLYICLKTINDAAQSLYADKPELAHRFGMAILHRHAGKKKGADQPSTPKPEKS